jgi:hypothetical protein
LRVADLSRGLLAQSEVFTVGKAPGTSTTATFG